MLRDRIMMGATISSLPEGYTKIEYLESDGNNYIDTGFKPNQDTRVVMDVHLLSTTTGDGYPMAFGVYTNNTNTFASFWNNSKWQVWLGDSSSSISSSNIERCVIDLQNGQYTVGSQSTSVSSSSFSSNLTLYLLAMNQGDVYYVSAARIYSCRIYDNGVLARDFIPCTNPDGISGLWDSVNNVFYKMLPAGYTKLDFIESDGTTYIDTGFKPNNNTRVVFEGYNNSTSSIWIFGAWKAKNDKMFAAAALNTYNICYGTKIRANATMPVGPISIDINKNAYTYNGVSGTLAAQTFSCDYPMYLFHINAAGTVSTGSFNGRIYSVKIYDNGTLVRDFIPAMNASGDAGLYDLKNDVWYALLLAVKPKVENKITFRYYIETAENPVTGLISAYTIITIYSTYAITSDLDIKFTNDIGTKTQTFTMSKGLSIYNPPGLRFFGMPTLISISPTEDDTYIYTF